MEGLKYVLVAIFIRALYSGMEIVSKAALNEGINAHVFVFYRQAFATIVIAPVAYFSERGRAPQMNLKLCFKIFMHAFIGITLSLNLYTIALDFTTAYTVSAANNSMPVCTFIVAVIYGSEIVKWRRASGITKLVGVALFVVGTCVIAFYKGPHLDPLTHHHPLGNEPTSGPKSHPNKPALGTFFAIACNTTWALWMVTQGRLLKEYPSKLLFTALQCIFSTISSFLVAVPFARDLSQWKLGFNLGLISVLYCGIIVSGFSFYLQSWVIEKKGPVFLALFTPLTLLLTLIASSFLLGEVISIGSLIGGVFMIGGLYSVLWGKNKEKKDNKKLPTTQNEIISAKTPKNCDFDIILEEKDMINKAQSTQTTDEKELLSAKTRDSDIVLEEKDMNDNVQAAQTTDDKAILQETEGGRA